MKICKIIAKKEDDYKYLITYLGKYPVILTQELNLEDNSIPTIIIGWSVVKEVFKQQNIFDKQIDKNLYWTYSKEEDEDANNKEIEAFVNSSIKKWLPFEFILFDPIFENKTLDDFLNENIDKDCKTFAYFYKGAIYLNNSNKNFIVNIKNIALINEDHKRVVTEFVNNLKPIVLSYKNLSKYLEFDILGCLYTFENIRWIKYKQEVTRSYFNLIPGFEIDKYIPFIMSNVVSFDLSEDEKRALRRACDRDKITEWLSKQEICVKKDFNKPGVSFSLKGENKLISVDYSNKRTLTGRIVPVGKYNPQNLAKNTEDRAQIISQFPKGKIIVFDYTSFEARIGLYSCEDVEFINKFKKSDLHYETAVIIFGRNQISKDEREFAKSVNHSILYGMSKQHIIEKLSYLKNPEETLYNIQVFLAPLLKKSKQILEGLEKRGYIINNWGTMVYPEKEFAAYNNFIQSSATEILVDKLYEIKEFLANYRSKFLFQVHDSLVFDICPEEQNVIKELAKIIMNYQGMYFSISYSSGFDYKNLSEPIEVLDSSCF